MKVMKAQRAQLPDGRWHFQHGPMDIIIGAAGEALTLSDAHKYAWERFIGILQELVQELPSLRCPVTAFARSPSRVMAVASRGGCEPTRRATPWSAPRGAGHNDPR